MHYAENECAMPIRLHCNELRALCLTTNALCRTAEFGALLLKCVLIVYIWPEKGVETSRRAVGLKQRGMWTDGVDGVDGRNEGRPRTPAVWENDEEGEGKKKSDFDLN